MIFDYFVITAIKTFQYIIIDIAFRYLLTYFAPCGRRMCEKIARANETNARIILVWSPFVIHLIISYKLLKRFRGCSWLTPLPVPWVFLGLFSRRNLLGTKDLAARQLAHANSVTRSQVAVNVKDLTLMVFIIVKKNKKKIRTTRKPRDGGVPSAPSDLTRDGSGSAKSSSRSHLRRLNTLGNT